jgi:hypothetical protein
MVRIGAFPVAPRLALVAVLLLPLGAAAAPPWIKNQGRTEEATKAEKASAPAAPAAKTGPAEVLATGTTPAAVIEVRPAAQPADPKVKSLEERVHDLRETISRGKPPSTLQEMVAGGAFTGGARAVFLHRNEMGNTFVLESVTYLLDGATVYTKKDVDGDLDLRREFEIFNGRLPPGTHRLGVKLTYRGNGFGVFPYLEGYRFKVQSFHNFTAEAGKVTMVKVVGFEKGGVTADLEERPAVRFDVDAEAENVAPAR